GNFPQAFSHVAIVNSARNLMQNNGPARQRGDQQPRHRQAGRRNATPAKKTPASERKRASRSRKRVR
ncbi:MAG TPA: hypothetical protein VFB32_13970, partial [Rudaea sp.]|nr:hypothetical protein [Rudaea sp.]